MKEELSSPTIGSGSNNKGNNPDRPDDIPVQVPGNGYCWDAQGQESTARRFTNADCEGAKFVCARDCNCVAWACQTGERGSVLYTSTHCSANCGNVDWLLNPDLILQAGHDEENHESLRSKGAVPVFSITRSFCSLKKDGNSP